MNIVNQKVELLDYMGTDISVVNAARVSFHKQSAYELRAVSSDGDCPDGEEEFVGERDQKLLAYLARHNHWSPFAHAFLSFRIKASIFVARHLVKHQVGLAWNEVSRRYVDDEPEFYFPEVWRGKPVNAKQGSSDEVLTMYHDTDTGLTLNINNEARYIVGQLLMMYKDFIKEGMAPEQARMILPHNLMTEWIWSGSLVAFARVCKLRLDSHAQAETREIAQMINDLIPEDFKYSWEALLNDS